MRARSQSYLWLRHAFLLTLVWGVLRPGAEAQVPRTHFVDVGVNGFPQFIDRDTGKSTLTTNPVPTVIRSGDSVQWVFQYSHSATNGSCPGGLCTPASPLLFDSQIQPGPFPSNFVKQFATPGIFPYFCQIHLSQMQGRVIVLDGPDFFLNVDINNQFFPPPPIPTITVAKGQAGTFTGNIAGFLGFKNPVHLSCGGAANPRVPANCPGTTVTPDGIGNPIPFNFIVAESVPGDFVFDIVATDSGNPVHTRSQQVKLTVFDFSVANPQPATVIAPPNLFSPVSVEVSTNLNTIVNVGCSINVPGVFCSGIGTSFPPSPQTLAVSIGNFGGTPSAFPIDIVASAFLQNGTSLTATTPVNLVVVGPATHFDSGALSSGMVKGVSFPVQLTAHDLLNSPVTNYAGKVHFTSTDPAAVLPVDYTFNAATDHGVHNFTAKLNSLGPRLIAANDVFAPQISWQSPIILVGPATAPNDTLAFASDRGPGNEAFFHDDVVNLDITVSGTSTPTGKVHLFDGAVEITSPSGLNLLQVHAGLAHAVVSLRLSPRSHVFTAVYDGNASFGANVSTFSQARSPAPRCVLGRCPGSH